MRPISTYKKQLGEANKVLTNDLRQKLDIERQIQELQKRRDEMEQRICADTRNVVTKGMLYYGPEMRERLLTQGQQLSYSELKIGKLRQFDNTNWNADHVDLEVITELQALEAYVGENAPDDTRGLLARLGRLIAGEEE